MKIVKIQESDEKEKESLIVTTMIEFAENITKLFLKRIEKTLSSTKVIFNLQKEQDKEREQRQRLKKENERLSTEITFFMKILKSSKASKKDY